MFERFRRVQAVLFVCTLSGYAPCGHAQESASAPSILIQRQSQARVALAAEWLKSDNPMHVAWGAWLARTENASDLAPLLLNRASAYARNNGETQGSQGRDWHAAMLQVLDALIELRIAVPAKDAGKLYPEFEAQSLILLLRSREDLEAPDKHQALLDILNKAGTNRAYLAAGNALLKTETRNGFWGPEIDLAFLSSLLERFTVHTTIVVEDPNRRTLSSIYLPGCFGIPEETPKNGWPRVGLYDLTQVPEKATQAEPYLTLISTSGFPGEDLPVYYWRAERNTYNNPPYARAECDDGNRDVYRARFLAALLLDGPVSSLNAYPRERIEWRGAEDFAEQFRAAVNKHVIALQNLRGSVLITLPPPLALPNLEIVIDDERSDKSVPIPEVQPEAPVKLRAVLSAPLP